MEYSIKLLALVLATFYVTSKIVTSIYRGYKDRKFAKAHGCLPPASFPSPYFGITNWWDIYKAAKISKHVDVICGRYPKYGNTWKGKILGNAAMGTIEPENIKTILATSFKDFDLGPLRHSNFFPLLGDGIFTLDGAGWEHSRALLRPQFSREQVSDLESLEIHVQRLINCIEKAGEVVNLLPLFYCLTLDSATEFLLGESVDSLLSSGNTTTGLPESSQNGKLGFGDAFNTSQHYLVVRGRMRGFHWLINPKKFRDANKVCHEFIDHFVDLALHPEKKQRKADPNQRRYIFLDAIAEDNKDPKHLRDQLLNILLAGRDTTASLLGFTFLLLAKHPRVFNKLRNEIIDAFGTGKDGNGKKPTFSGLKDVTYLRYVLNEGEFLVHLLGHQLNSADNAGQSTSTLPCCTFEQPFCEQKYYPPPRWRS